MRTIATTVLLLVLSSLSAIAQAEMITKKSAHSVAVTMDRLEVAAKEKGAAIVARVNHAAAAAKVDMPLRPTEVLIFGNPKLGTPLMQSNQQAGFDLPLKVVAWEDAAGIVWVGYNAPSALAAQYAINDRAETVQKMIAVLDQITDQAIKP
jgi:uncharacterized protein (DUF302 family)